MADLEYGKDVPKVYSESRWLQCGLRLCGNACCVFLGLCGVAWVFHAIPTQWGYVSDMPSYGKTLLWASLAYHTDAYSGYRTAFSPPPPSFSRQLFELPSDGSQWHSCKGAAVLCSVMYTYDDCVSERDCEWHG